MKTYFYDGTNILCYCSTNQKSIFTKTIPNNAYVYVKHLSDYKDGFNGYGSVVKIIKNKNAVLAIEQEHLHIRSIDVLCGDDIKQDCEEMLYNALLVDDLSSRVPPISLSQVARREIDEAASTSKEKYCNAQWHLVNAQNESRLLEKLQCAYNGGSIICDTDELMTLHEHGYCYDIKSDYPFQMLTNYFPVGRAYHWREGRFNYDKDKLETNAYLLQVKFKNIEPKGLFKIFNARSLFLGRTKVTEPIFDATNKLVFAKEIDTYLTDIDFELVKKAYNFTEVAIGEVYEFETAPLPEYLRNYIYNLFVKKETETNEKKKSVKKRKLNSVYGSCCLLHDNYEDSKRNALAFSWGVWTASYARRTQYELLQMKGAYYSAVDSVLSDKLNGKFVNEFNKRNLEKFEMCGYETVNGKFAGQLVVEKAENVVIEGTNSYTKNGLSYISGLPKQTMSVEQFINRKQFDALEDYLIKTEIEIEFY